MQGIHVKPENGWMNDPNGFIYYKGWYHLFYQCFPYDARWGRMHWKHLISKDLINWEDLGIALYPSKTDDRSGCFSGSAIEDNGRMYLYYTGVNYLKENPEDINLCLEDQYISSQMMIVSEDGIHFDNILNKKTVIPVIRDRSIGDARNTRDPKVWKQNDEWYMVLGSTIDDKSGRLLFYRSKDKESWEFVNSVSKGEGFGWMWECPDYFELNGKQILLFSPMGIMKDEYKEKNQSICMQVNFETKTCRMEMPDNYQFVDYGLDLYAPQTTLDENGRRIMIGWLRMPENVDGKWQGMMCIPRVVEVKNNHIYFRVHPNIRKLYVKQIADPAAAHKAGYRLSFSLEDGESVDIGGYRICRKGKKICTDRKKLYKAFSEMRTSFSTPELLAGFDLEVYVDKNAIEIFVNDGEAVISNIVYDPGTELKISGDIKIRMDTLG